MRVSRVAAMTSILSTLVAATAFAQAPQPPRESTSAPNSASTPSQRETTTSGARESSTTQPSEASTPHQREAMGGKAQTMKDCMAEQGTIQAGKSQADMTKFCEEQMKKQKTRSAASKDAGAPGPASMPKPAESTTTAPPK